MPQPEVHSKVATVSKATADALYYENRPARPGPELMIPFDEPRVASCLQEFKTWINKNSKSSIVDRCIEAVRIVHRTWGGYDFTRVDSSGFVRDWNDFNAKQQKEQKELEKIQDPIERLTKEMALQSKQLDAMEKLYRRAVTELGVAGETAAGPTNVRDFKNGSLICRQFAPIVHALLIQNSIKSQVIAGTVKFPNQDVGGHVFVFLPAVDAIVETTAAANQPAVVRVTGGRRAFNSEGLPVVVVSTDAQTDYGFEKQWTVLHQNNNQVFTGKALLREEAKANAAAVSLPAPLIRNSDRQN